MTPTNKGSFRLFQIAGITVFLHWSWFVVALFEVQDPANRYHSLAWNAVEYVALFGIVLLHEFGHALACRSVGGGAEQIVLWPLGGVAYVSPPPRPGATLWSIAAGPLVNVVLAVPLTAIVVAGEMLEWWPKGSEVRMLVISLWFINAALLVFNLLPVYPLDGGKILWALLWFVFGRAKSLMVAAVIGMIGVVGVIAVAVLARSVWIGIMAVFILMSCWRGLQTARVLARLDRLPRHDGFACPSCKEAPPRGPFWQCNQCGAAFDAFETGAACPQCATQFPATRCIHCGGQNPLADWRIAPPMVSQAD
jgi:Zn-dependent protease